MLNCLKIAILYFYLFPYLFTTSFRRQKVIRAPLRKKSMQLSTKTKRLLIFRFLSLYKHEEGDSLFFGGRLPHAKNYWR